MCDIYICLNAFKVVADLMMFFGILFCCREEERNVESAKRRFTLRSVLRREELRTTNYASSAATAKCL